MSADLSQGSPLANALNEAIQVKIADLGWATGAEGAAMSEYFVLMLANGKTAADVSAEISGELLGLGPEDQTAPAFAQWLFEHYHALSAQMSAASAAPGSNGQGATEQDDSMDGQFDANMDIMTDGAAGELNAPTGPKAMRAGGAPRGMGREKRMVGHINRAMDRNHDSSVLHRTRGQSGVSRGPPTGPRMGVGRQPRTTNARTASVAAGLAGMGMPMGGVPGMNGMNPMGGMSGMPGMNGGFASPEILAMMEQQNRMLQQMSQQLMMQQQVGTNGHNRPGKFDRNNRGGNFRRGGGHHPNNNNHSNGHTPQTQPSENEQTEPTQQQGEDVDMSGRREALNPEDTICKYNARCTNKDCKFAHASPAAPFNATIDVKDVCTFGAACKNWKCTGRHPSPAAKMAHQSEMDCKFFPNCTNPHCTFRHPTMPPCRNGGECKVPNCKFTHVKTACKFNPCTNRTCPFTHEEGQRGTFKDKVWVADEGKEHVSERKFVAEGGTEETIIPGTEMGDEGMPEVIV